MDIYIVNLAPYHADDTRLPLYTFCLTFQLPSSSTRVAPIRTLEDGPTTRQKILVVSIWIFASIFGFLTCFPDKLSGGLEVESDSDLPVLTLAPSELESTAPSSGEILTEASAESPVESQPVELSYCSVKNGVNDMLDYIALVVALVAPLIIGPCIVGVFQVRITHSTILTILQYHRDLARNMYCLEYIYFTDTLVEDKYWTVDVVLVKSKGKIVENPCRCSKILLQWKFQIDFRTKVLNQYISENVWIIHFRPF